MSRKTFVRACMASDHGPEVEETWTIQTHEMDEEWWSEILDAHLHPQVRTDDYGFDTVVKYFGDTAQESIEAARKALEEIVRGRGGRVADPGKAEG